MNEKKNKIFVKIKHCIGFMVHAKNCLKNVIFKFDSIKDMEESH